MAAEHFGSFGRATPSAPRAIPANEAIALLKSGAAEPGSLLGYGNGRSYGDSCQNHAGAVVDMRPLNRIRSFNAETGIIEADAGVLLCEIIAHAAPYGFFPAVVPGTQFVTLGGAIANDVHGKNHHRRGTFGCHVESLTLLRSDGRTYCCSHTDNAPLFRATVGGMGLTGVILSASIRLMRVPSLDIVEKATPFRNLGEFFELAEAADQANEYVVAWIDQLAGGHGRGRGLLLTGNHAEHGSHAASRAGSRLAVPVQPPFNVLNRTSLTLFNAAYRWRKGRSSTPRQAGYQSFFFPLDGVRGWNRLYGPRGLFQHQSVVPEANARSAVRALLEATRRAGQSSFLTVLKRFGDGRSPGLLSFPRPGYTLTLDFPNRGERTLRLLAELDRVTVAAGGAVNPYKDARMSAEAFAASFPEWQRLETLRDPGFMSSFWARTAKKLDVSQAAAQAAE
ncbi:FAD-binding oxidoreductase [Mesorhizobium sp. M3A.F.Ca.ET.174.01.1.1]|uniref:FAD-binding oxidoreductase n=1 Tax=unclassified Mesorhizobium TaxID=325217 RepID=UPI001093B194|nr:MULTISPECIES: FAD-binding oxidoreductase [unclassified Mesorhizobium]TGS84966.1 FAD-binding oxidoreductase [Mesorhizobium sp. M3A.F.Ca.ET.175.01.1.1]TGT23369.1 FAD-binding oxidoreductase [Mesorhizobium sp. M3A.F.Ca.ET.174.01.1.1]